MCDKKPHPHCEVIIAWAKGAEIQYSNNGNDWFATPTPNWAIETHYRVKPKKKVKKYKYAAKHRTLGTYITNNYFAGFEEFEESSDSYGVVDATCLSWDYIEVEE